MTQGRVADETWLVLRTEPDLKKLFTSVSAQPVSFSLSPPHFQVSEDAPGTLFFSSQYGNLHEATKQFFLYSFNWISLVSRKKTHRHFWSNAMLQGTTSTWLWRTGKVIWSIPARTWNYGSMQFAHENQIARYQMMSTFKLVLVRRLLYSLPTVSWSKVYEVLRV